MAPKQNATAVPQGQTALTMPFSVVELSRPAAYYPNRDRTGNVTGINAIQARLPIIVAGFGAMTVTVKAYLNRQAAGNWTPKVSWPQAVAADDKLKSAAIAHVTRAIKAWPQADAALQAAYREVQAVITGKAVAVKGETEALTFEPKPDPIAEAVAETVAALEPFTPSAEPVTEPATEGAKTV